MNRFHVNPKGEAGKCSAQAGQCPFGGEQTHYATLEKAQQAFELSMAAEQVPAPLTRDPFENLSDHFIRSNGNAISALPDLGGDEQLTRLSLQVIEEADDDHEANLNRLAPHDREAVLATYTSFHKSLAVAMNEHGLDSEMVTPTDASLLASLRTVRKEVSHIAEVLNLARGRYGAIDWELPEYAMALELNRDNEWEVTYGDSYPATFNVHDGYLQDAYWAKHGFLEWTVDIRGLD